jgi:chemotaxis protein methyltransferase CheR
MFLYYRIEQIMGIRITDDALVRLNEYVENRCGCSFLEDPAVYAKELTSRENIFDIAKTVTINETYFFREGAHFNLLEHRFLPELAKLDRPIKICSAASSIGCEAYSIAMLLDYYREKTGGSFDFEVDAFDVTGEAIETAKRGRYTANSVRSDGEAWKHITDRYLVKDGKEYIVRSDIRSLVRFFPHNVMRGLDKKYDIIFFRNALIYFTPEGRLAALSNLAESLFNGGLLFLGVSETSVAVHPLLSNKNIQNVFFMQKIGAEESAAKTHTSKGITNRLLTHGRIRPDTHRQPAVKKHKKDASAAESSAGQEPVTGMFPSQDMPKDTGINYASVAGFLEADEGQTNAAKTVDTIRSRNISDTRPVSASELAAAAVYFLGRQNYDDADLVLSYMETHGSGSGVLFLRGEYHLLKDSESEARRCFEQAAGKEKAFWPALYRLATLASPEENGRWQEQKLRTACESLQLGRDLKYECFMGGFSPDYFRRILERRLGKSAEQGQ